MEPEWIAAAAGIVGALGAVLVQGLLGHLSGASDRKRELLLQSYQALIEATASIAAAGEDRGTALRDLIAAKQRVLYFGPVEVVHALAEFGRTSQRLLDAEAVGAFAQMLRAMRTSLDLPAIEDRDLLRVLVGRDQLSPLPQRVIESPGGSKVDESPQAPSS